VRAQVVPQGEELEPPWPFELFGQAHRRKTYAFSMLVLCIAYATGPSALASRLADFLEPAGRRLVAFRGALLALGDAAR
jgi:hypothetical protein